MSVLRVKLSIEFLRAEHRDTFQASGHKGQATVVNLNCYQPRWAHVPPAVIKIVRATIVQFAQGLSSHAARYPSCTRRKGRGEYLDISFAHLDSLERRPRYCVRSPLAPRYHNGTVKVKRKVERRPPTGDFNAWIALSAFGRSAYAGGIPALPAVSKENRRTRCFDLGTCSEELSVNFDNLRWVRYFGSKSGASVALYRVDS